MFKFWFKVLHSETCIIRNCYDELYCIKEKLDEIGLGYIWCEQENSTCAFKFFFPIIKQRLIDIFVQNMSKLVIQNVYKHVIEHFSLQYYLCKPIPYEKAY
jgi:hypothetical protein